jgi:hypothetical protein
VSSDEEMERFLHGHLGRVRDIAPLQNSRLILIVERNYGGGVLASRIANACAPYAPVGVMTQDSPSARVRCAEELEAAALGAALRQSEADGIWPAARAAATTGVAHAGVEPAAMPLIRAASGAPIVSVRAIGAAGRCAPPETIAFSAIVTASLRADAIA